MNALRELCVLTSCLCGLFPIIHHNGTKDRTQRPQIGSDLLNCANCSVWFRRCELCQFANTREKIPIPLWAFPCTTLHDSLYHFGECAVPLRVQLLQKIILVEVEHGTFFVVRRITIWRYLERDERAIVSWNTEFVGTRRWSNL